ncbi:hypothetical protein QL285_067665 [Trifolium repens]|nr:hypothetical protein QL285_067665 [Trifolium repens]
MKKELNSKKNQRTEHVTYLGRQVKSSAELVKMMKMKRENGIDAAHIIAEVQGSILNQNMPSRNVGGTKASKSQLVGVQGTNTKPTKQCRNIGGTKATMAEGPNKSSLNISSLNVAEIIHLRERLKHRPKTIPKNHYKKLMIYWGINIVQDICKKNAVNRAKQKYIHRMGSKSFARVKAQMRAKKEDGSDVTQAEIFIETRTGQKGKKVDQDTQNVVTKLHDSIKDSNECAAKTFQSIFGKEKAGRVRCLGRTVTPTVLKRNEDIAAIKRQYSNETTHMAKKLDGLQGLVRCLLKQANPDMDDEALDTIMEKAMDNGASTSTHMHDLDKEIHPTFEEGELEVEDEDEDDE